MRTSPHCLSVALTTLTFLLLLTAGCAPPAIDDGGVAADGGVDNEDGGAPPGDDDAGPQGDDDAGLPNEDDAGISPPGPPPTLTVTGTVIDFATRAQLTGAATVSPVDILPPPTVEMSGANFTLTNVAGYSVFRLLAGAVGYRSTFSQPVQVGEANISAVTVEAVSTAFVQDAAAEFGVTIAAGTGIVFARAVDENGAAVSGVPGSAFHVNGAAPVAGPYFLDAQRQPDAGLTSTSASGYALFFNVAVGDVTIDASPTSSYALASVPAPVEGDTATRTNVRAEAGEFELPPNVSFDDDVVPVFTSKGCTDCHSGGGIGFDLGGLMLDAGRNLTYRELTEELSPTYGVPRVNTVDPEASLLLHVPTTGPDIHPIQMFVGYSDPDYLTLLSWITDGALQN